MSLARCGWPPGVEKAKLFRRMALDATGTQRHRDACQWARKSSCGRQRRPVPVSAPPICPRLQRPIENRCYPRLVRRGCQILPQGIIRIVDRAAVSVVAALHSIRRLRATLEKGRP
jgi:hypothetical protein